MRKKALVIGLAKSGWATINLLREHNFDITLSTNEKISAEDKHKLSGVHIYDGEHLFALLDEKYDYVIKNPGIPYHNPFIKEVVAKKHYLITEIELAYQLSKNKYYAITGTNGKTTTVSLIYDILKSTLNNTYLAGNIGFPLSQLIVDHGNNNNFVIELSNFQLLGIDTFKPKIATILNLAPDHLDYMDSLEEYYQSKMKIYQNQDENDFFILNLDDHLLQEYTRNIKASIITFSLSQKADVELHNDWIYYKNKAIIDLSLIKVVGLHNVANIMVALAYAMILKIPIDEIRKAVYNFTGVSYRLQKVIGGNGNVYYNDSKATSPEATLIALKAMNEDINIILGGFDKKLSYTELMSNINKNELVKQVITFGAIGSEIAMLSKKPTKTFNTLDEVIHYLNKSNNKIVSLFSPGTSSFDQYQNFEKRGEHFNQLIKGGFTNENNL